MEDTNRPIRVREAFVLELGRALHGAGTPAHRLEETLSQVSDQLGLISQFFSTPTSLWGGFGPPEAQRVTLARVEPGDVNLERTVLLDELAREVATGALDIETGRERLRAIGEGVDRYPAWTVPPAFAVASGCAGIFFGRSWIEAGIAAGIAFVIGLFALVTARHRNMARLMDFLAGLVAASVALLAQTWIPGVDSYTVTLAGVIVLVPGLTLTLAVSELASRHLISGTARLMHALMIFLAIGFGVAMGRSIERMLPPSEGTLAAAPAWALWPMLLVAPFAFALLFRARPKDMPLIAISGIIAFVGARTGALILGPELGASLGAFLMGVFANGHARVTRRPSAILKIPGLILLVPGSIGFKSFSSLLEQDPTQGIGTAFSMILVAVSIVAGLLVAQAALPPRQTL
ncbi:MAG: threonine/serine ThrE exporter family protein [Phycisphaerales bacterium]